MINRSSVGHIVHRESEEVYTITEVLHIENAL